MIEEVQILNNEDRALRVALQESQQQTEGAIPDFETVFTAAQRASRDKSRMLIAGLAAAIAVALLTVGLLPISESEITYVDVEELVATTSWTAPSDFLLPEHQIDIYREMPVLFESTELDEGTLL